MKYISFPSKTFLIGEYAVLQKAPCVIVNTTPRFYFSITNRLQNIKPIFHKQSPAFQWIKKYPDIINSYTIKVYDPHRRQGGFGLSGAEFNLMYFLGQCLKSPSLWKQTKKKIDIFKMWQSYCLLNFSGVKPSGADIVSQWVGDMCIFCTDPFNVESVKWNFLDLEFFLIRTENSLNTWEHLETLKTTDFLTLGTLAKQAITYIKQVDTKSFVSVIDKYADCLQKQHLVHKKTSLLLNKIKSHKAVITAKGCGAMGAEVIAVFFHPKNKQEVKSCIKNLVSHSSDLTYGMQIHNSMVDYNKFTLG